jgi:alkylation response protein AidB-like acyl-CoA dehydrogenase
MQAGAGRPGQAPGAQSAQIYEGTNQIQRVVMACQLLKG